ncbi:MAG: nitroreductase family protein [Phaeovulum sp.]|uniref:nitroreductase family protein n=1 Tax=Phaeovulum sp. TaxID=2934796 RepID=UPI002735B27A|nr:nitroreductase family protein [Phaeovulum sp.]MDP3860160.1 nitroreductase family protein [Phaeovulum sp.]
MPAAQPEALQFLLSRRSHPAKTLRAPGPDRAALEPLLTAALRVPDHGKLEPWRLIVLARPALERLAAAAAARAEALAMPVDQAAKGISQFADSPLCVAVVSSPKPSDKAPEVEQLLSAGAVALSLLNAALAAGWGAAWLTGWPAYDAEFRAEALGLAAGERVVGFVHVGTAAGVSPERPRPDLAALTEWRGF